MAEFDPTARLRSGDPSAWPRYNPEFLGAGEVTQAWVEAARRAGEPGRPEAIRVYTHFAYCESSCNFCMYFHQVPQQREAHGRYVNHLVASIERFEAGAGRVRATAAYVGGGTPSAAPAPELRRYFQAFRAAFDVSGEFSFEAHPRSMDLEKLELAHAHGVNRMSMGIQSLEPGVLREITRKNAPLEAIGELVAAARRLGILVNLDLVLGLPGQTLESFRADVTRVMELGADVVTLYRYQAVERLRHVVPDAMDYARALDDALRASVEAHGYRLADRMTEQASVLRLMRTDAIQPRWDAPQLYALFDELPSNLIGFGPGAYGHAFGYGWFRDATSMERLGGEPLYWGTRLSALDECRTALLEAFASGRPLDTAWLGRKAGVDVEAAFFEPLRRARQHGLLARSTRPGLTSATLAPELRDELIDTLMPARAEPRDEAPPPAFQPELVALRVRRSDVDRPDAALVRAFCSAVGVPARGRRIFGVQVRDVDERSVSFKVPGAGAMPLRVHVRKPGSGPSFFETPRFAIQFGTREGQPLAEEEKQFLVKIARAMREADPPVGRGT